MDSLGRWTDINPQNILNKDQKHRREGAFQTTEQKQSPCPCAYCDKQGHKADQCESIKRCRRSQVKHRASDCRSNKLCLICNSNHHTSICDKNENILLTTNSNACTYPLVIVNIEGIKCRALVDTGAGASYVSSTIINLINQKTNKKPIRTESKQIETLLSSSIRNIPVYSIEIKDINNKFSFKTEISKLEKCVLLELPNTNHREIQNSYRHLRDITLNDYDTKSQLPIHMMLGISDYTTIKTLERVRIGLPGNLFQN